MKQFLKNWWVGLKYSPDDPRYNAGGAIKIAAIGGGTGLANLLRGLKFYSNKISAIVTVADNGGLSTASIRKEFDMVAPGDIRQCIAALAYNEELIANIFEHRFSRDRKLFGGHTLGNIWLTALTDYYGSFDKAIEVTSEIFKTAGKVLPATLEKIDLRIEYEDGTKVKGEYNLDEITKRPKRITLNKDGVKAYSKAVTAIEEADLIIIGPGSLYASIIPNLIIPGIRNAIFRNTHAIKVYIVNCSTERTQTANYSIADHIQALIDHTGKPFFDYCLVNDRIVSTSKKEKEIGEIHNITTSKEEILGCNIIRDDVINEEQPLYHDSEKLSQAIISFYRKLK